MIPPHIIEAILSLDPCEPAARRAALESADSIEAAIESTSTTDLAWLAYRVDSEATAPAWAACNKARARARAACNKARARARAAERAKCVAEISRALHRMAVEEMDSDARSAGLHEAAMFVERNGR